MEVKEIEQTKTKEDILELLDANNIAYSINKCHGCEIICISVGDEQNCCCKPQVMVQTYNKDTIFNVNLNEILYVAIENRKSVLYLIDRKIETRYSIDYWKNILNEKYFAQPHYSYLVNLFYVYEVTKDFVTLKYRDNEYKVYTSSRKIAAFKKALFNFNNCHSY